MAKSNVDNRLSVLEAGIAETNESIAALVAAISGKVAPAVELTPLQKAMAEVERLQGNLAAMENITGSGKANPLPHLIDANPNVAEKREFQPYIDKGEDFTGRDGKQVKGQLLLHLGYRFSIGAGKAKMLARAGIKGGLLDELIRRQAVLDSAAGK